MNKPLPREVEQQIAEATDHFRQELTELWEWVLDEESEMPATALEIEHRIRDWIRQIGEDTQAQTLGQLERYRVKGKQACPGCGAEIYWTRYTPRQHVSSLGELTIERVYYHHGACHTGWVPLDERLGLGSSELSPLVQEMASYLGAWMPFEQATTYLAKYQDIHISHDSVNRSTVQIGQALQAQQEQAVAAAWEEQELPACEVATPPTRLYISSDGIRHLLPDGEGKEIKVAAVYETEERETANGEVEIHARDIEYVVAATGEELAQAVYLRAVQCGVLAADEIGVLGDGANWIWNRIAAQFPKRKTTEIVDFYHASEYLWDVARAVWGVESEQTHAWGTEHCHTLKHEGGTAIQAVLSDLPVDSDAPPKDVVDARTYFDNQHSRMDYPAYRAGGWQIGSGSAESGVKQVVGVRLNQAGMRWDPDHAVAVAHVRATILSDRWDAFWDAYQPPPRQYRRHAPLPAAA